MDSTAPGGSVRPDIVQAVYSALFEVNPARLLALEAAGEHVTAAERAAAENLFLESMMASLDHHERTLQAMKVLFGERKFTGRPSWADLFDGLSPDDAAGLRDLYDALPDGARAEYDQRYGHPEEGG
jgi:hypothetical protein